MNTKFTLPKKFYDFIKKQKFEVESDSHYFLNQIIRPEIIEKYGEFYSTQKNSDGEITRGTYMIRDNTPELIMSYDNSLWYEIYFEDGKAVEVKLREGYIGG